MKLLIALVACVCLCLAWLAIWRCKREDSTFLLSAKVKIRKKFYPCSPSKSIHRALIVPPHVRLLISLPVI
jgi:cytochrome oxidase assembly protein ShyY1